MEFSWQKLESGEYWQKYVLCDTKILFVKKKSEKEKKFVDNYAKPNFSLRFKADISWELEKKQSMIFCCFTGFKIRQCQQMTQERRVFINVTWHFSQFLISFLTNFRSSKCQKNQLSRPIGEGVAPVSQMEKSVTFYLIKLSLSKALILAEGK